MPSDVLTVQSTIFREGIEVSFDCKCFRVLEGFQTIRTLVFFDMASFFLLYNLSGAVRIC